MAETNRLRPEARKNWFLKAAIADLAEPAEIDGTGQRVNDLLDHAVDEILLVGVGAHVLERQHSDRGPVRYRSSLVREFRDLADEADALASEGAD
jgi:hypothetical protein